MRKTTLWMIALTLAFLWSPEASAQSKLRIENVETQLVGAPDSAGFVTFTVRAQARNVSGTGQRFFVTVMAVDSSGTSLRTVDLRGRISGREVGILEGIGTMTLDEYNSIVSWVQMTR
jgi:hypothetical protein